MMNKCYSELMEYRSFEDRFEYLKLGGIVGAQTFGGNRYLNQLLYNSDYWKEIRDYVIDRDRGCDLAVDPIYTVVLVHHINPITVSQVRNRDPIIFDLENLITTMFDTHQAIHYGNSNYLIGRRLIERRPNDTSPWR